MQENRKILFVFETGWIATNSRAVPAAFTLSSTVAVVIRQQGTYLHGRPLNRAINRRCGQFAPGSNNCHGAAAAPPIVGDKRAVRARVRRLLRVPVTRNLHPVRFAVITGRKSSTGL